ncbi:MAG: hypothetical protein AAFX99_07855, partial [Myxococcota bacterium]
HDTPFVGETPIWPYQPCITAPRLHACLFGQGALLKVPTPQPRELVREALQEIEPEANVNSPSDRGLGS